ncbi:hypothetical protein QUF58_11360 [Anaerolineales bacterium HSG24]|nr:hypothetical protein [Anaerolineales bacterium HSG24]
MVKKIDNQTTTEDSGPSKRRIIIFILLLLLLSMTCIFCSAQSAIMSINRETLKADLLPEKFPDYEDEGLVFAPLNEDILEEVRADYDRLNLQPVIEIDAVEDNVEIAALPEPEILAQPTVEVVVVSFPTPTPTPSPTPITSTNTVDDGSSATAVAKQATDDNKNDATAAPPSTAPPKPPTAI